MKFTVITPGFNQLNFLKRCIASVRDQITMEGQRSGVRGEQRGANSCELNVRGSSHVYHHVQDGGSKDGSREFLVEHLANSEHLSANDYTFSFSSEPDDGMYDALNKGIERMLGDQRIDDRGQTANNSQLPTPNFDDSIVAWLNCDEQYLPGTLQKVEDYFETHPEVDFVYGNTLLLDPEGSLLTYRKNPPLREMYIQSDHLYTQSSSMFFRSRVFQGGLRFDTRWKAVSDCDFVLRLFENGFRPGRINDFLSVFVMTGENLSGSTAGMLELRNWRKTMPLALRAMYFPLRGCRYIEKWLTGGYRENFPMKYEIYISKKSDERSLFCADTGSSHFVSWSR